jgi:rare lipoprotein A
VIAAWRLRRDPPMNGPVTASWYGLGGSGACGVDVQSGLRFASLFLPCGEVIRMCHGSACVQAEMADRGPYVGGRAFDLNANLRDALGCGDLCEVTWR